MSLATWLTGAYNDGLFGHRGTVTTYVNVDIGAAGAPTLRDNTARLTVTRVSAGLYRFAFLSGPVKSLRCALPHVNLIAATTGGIDAKLTADNSASNTAPGFDITCVAAGGVTATDPANGNSLTIAVVVGTQN